MAARRAGAAARGAAHRQPHERRRDRSIAGHRHRLAAFAEGLQQAGWIDGRNVRIDHRWAAGDAERYFTLRCGLVALAPDVILATAGPSVVALQQATRTVPIVFVQLIDPVGAGLVASLARPGGNITGFTAFEYGMSAKWLELLKGIDPRDACGGGFQDPASPPVSRFPPLGRSCPLVRVVRPLSECRRVERAVAAFAHGANGGLIVTASPAIAARRELIMTLAARHRLPAVYPLPPSSTEAACSYGSTGSNLPACRRLRRSNSQGRQAGRLAGASADEIRTGNQPQDCKRARPRSAADAARAC